MHTPVFLNQTIDALNPVEGGRYVDATTGEGGHTRAILERGGEVLSLDWDESQCKALKLQFEGNSKVHVVNTNFADIEEVAKREGFIPVDGVLFDFGLSMTQLNTGKRGLSFKYDAEPLDMRIGDAEITAADILRSRSVDELYDIFAGNSEEMYSRKIAERIVTMRKRYPYETVLDLKVAINDSVPFAKKDDANMSPTYSRIFQALRIAVNNEFENLKRGLLGASHIVKPGGRIAVITFHSIEDRMVKQFARANGMQLIKPVKSDFKIKKKFERSAMLRILVINENK